MAAKTGLTAVYHGIAYGVNRGTYSLSPVCVGPAAGAFTEAVSYSITSSVVSMVPAALAAGLGDAATCGFLGVASSA